MSVGAPASSVDEVLDLFERYGHERYDEEVTQLSHALQCAELATADQASDQLVAAALLHDVGHLLEIADGQLTPSATDLEHEHLGARYLSGLFPSSVTTPIGLHVLAKRYLCATEQDYLDRLSPGSVASLRVQGGPLTPEGAASFEDQPSCAGAVAVRRWDDGGKRLDREPAGLDAYTDLLERVATTAR